MRQLLYTLLSVFLGYRSVMLVDRLATAPSPEQWPWGPQIIVAVLLALFVTGAFAFAGFVWPTHRVLPKGYYRVPNAAATGAFAKRIGVPRFRRFLLATFWRDRGKRRQFFDGTRAGLSHFGYQSRQAEFGHLIPFVLLLVLSAWLAWRGVYVMVAVLSVLNVVGNFYPVVLQRWHRGRIARLAARRLR